MMDPRLSSINEKSRIPYDGESLAGQDYYNSNLHSEVDQVSNSLRSMNTLYAAIKIALDACNSRISFSEDFHARNFERQEDKLNYIIKRIEALEQREKENLGFQISAIEYYNDLEKRVTGMSIEVDSFRQRLAVIDERYDVQRIEVDQLESQVGISEGRRKELQPDFENFRKNFGLIKKDVEILGIRLRERAEGIESTAKRTEIQTIRLGHLKDEAEEKHSNLSRHGDVMEKETIDLYDNLLKTNSKIRKNEQAIGKVENNLIARACEQDIYMKQRENKKAEVVRKVEIDKETKLKKAHREAKSERTSNKVVKEKELRDLYSMSLDGDEILLKRILESMEDDEILEKYDCVLAKEEKETMYKYTVEYDKDDMRRNLDRFLKKVKIHDVDIKRVKEILKKKDYLYSLEYRDKQMKFKPIVNIEKALKRRNGEDLFAYIGRGYRYIPYNQYLEAIKERDDKLKKEAEERERTKQLRNNFHDNCGPMRYNNFRFNNWNNFGSRYNNRNDYDYNNNVMFKEILEAIEKLPKNYRPATDPRSFV
jgi:hypothetical protein